MKTIKHYSRKELLALPERPWAEPTIYQSLLIFPPGTLHDSDYANLAIIGCNDLKPIEICTTNSDDITWHNLTTHDFRMDCMPRSKALHAWSDKVKFLVGHSLSSITIKLLPIT